jgi:non-ribosomal peptide synthetase component F
MKLPPEQEAIRAKCFHPSGVFVEFPMEDVETSIPARFEKIVRMYPERVAVKTITQTVSYFELNRRANRLARRILTRRGEGPEPVGLFLTDGADVIMAHLAVLKAGKFSMSLDPLDALDRTRHLLNDSCTALVITDKSSGSIADLWNNRSIAQIDIDERACVVGEDALHITVPGDAYAYLRYTSGSTGQAKGALKTHRHVLHAVMNATNNFHICAEERSTILTLNSSLGKYAFEVLLNGAALYPFYVKEEGLLNLADWVRREEMTFFYSFPTAFRHFLGALDAQNNFPSLRLIRLEGEPVYRNDVVQYQRLFAEDCLLANSFSSTETGPLCLYFVDKQTEITGSRLPAGYPVDGVEISLLDESGKDVGCNQPGEVVVKSPFLSSGYWQRSELTDARFQAEQDGEDARRYVTGDIAIRTDTGCLEIVGRKDFQVKIRSFRVDVGDVEAALAVHPEVKEVVVVSRQDESGDDTLVAYFVPRHMPAPTTTVLRKFLATTLVDYMIPSRFIVIENIPLLSTGKVDRRALPMLRSGRPDLETLFAAPTTPAEQSLSQIWAEVLHLDQVGIHDNFFDLGGHSLSGSRVISRVLETFRMDLALSVVFDSPTVAEMALIITTNQSRRQSDAELEPILAAVRGLRQD